MRILCTGSLGFIGSHLCEMAQAQGHEVLGLDAKRYSAREKNLPAGIDWALCDVCDAGQVAYAFDTFQPDAVFHLAAETHVARSIESRDEFLRTNVLGTNVMLEECLKYWTALNQKTIGGPSPWFKLIQVSTDEVYGSLGPDDEPWTEASPFQPNNPYAASKAAADHLARSYWKTYGLPVITTHCANNYGPRQHPEKLIPTLLGQLMRDEMLTVHGDGKHVRDWIHVDDHCRGLLAALEFGQPGETYNFGGSCERTNMEIAILLAQEFALYGSSGFCCPTVMTPDRPGNDRRYATNWQHAWRELGWKPGPPIEDRIAKVVQWYLENPNYGAEYAAI